MTPSFRRPGGFINFAVSRARVVPDDKNPAVFALEAVDGAWKEPETLFARFTKISEVWPVVQLKFFADTKLQPLSPAHWPHSEPLHTCTSCISLHLAGRAAKKESEKCLLAGSFHNNRLGSPTRRSLDREHGTAVDWGTT